MFNKYTTAIFAAVISSLAVTSCFAISVAAQAFAQGTQSSGAANSANNQSSTN